MDKFSHIYCENPTILLVHDFDFLFRKYGSIVVKNVVKARFGRYRGVDRTQFYPKKNGINLDNISDCYFLNEKTGEISPLYMAVPCGKCLLCRDKKVRELSCRCIAETNEYDSLPLFLTFTYAPEFLPECGLQKSDLQMFFKRLRSRLDYYNIEHNIRYLAVGEYGSQTKRAHYHAIIWNFPKDKAFPNILSVQHFIQRCWSRYLFDGFGKRIPLTDFNGEIVRFPSGKIVHRTTPIGWVKTLPVKTGCPGYVLKYMRKKCDVPLGKNDTFMIASNRGGGIGSAFVRRQRALFYGHPSLLHLQILDKMCSGKVFNMPITSYVKNMLVPSVSSKIPKKEYDIIKEFYNDLDLFFGLCQRIRQLRGGFDVETIDGTIHYYEPSFSIHHKSDWLQALKRTSYMKKCYYAVSDLNFQFLKNERDCWDWYVEISDRLNINSLKILDFPDYRPYFRERDNFMKKRIEILGDIFLNSEKVNITAIANSINVRIERNKLKEVI